MNSVEVGNLLAKRFIMRSDVKAWQQPGGAYIPDRTPITREDLNGHLECTSRTGTVSDGNGGILRYKDERPMQVHKGVMGHYMLGAGDQCKFFCFDIDLAVDGFWDGEPIKPREEFANIASPYREGLVGQLVIMAEGLARHVHKMFEIPVAIAFSGAKGVHVYGLTGPTVAGNVRAAALAVIGEISQIKTLRGENFFHHENPEMATEIEVFPKQDSLDGKDLGNLLRLPLGRNLKGKEGMFLRCGGGKRANFQQMDPIAALSGELPWSK